MARSFRCISASVLRWPPRPSAACDFLIGRARDGRVPVARIDWIKAFAHTSRTNCAGAVHDQICIRAFADGGTYGERRGERRRDVGEERLFHRVELALPAGT